MSLHDLMAVIAKPYARSGGPTADETHRIAEVAEAVLAAGYRLVPEGHLVIPAPSVNHKGPHDNEAAIYRWAARTLDLGYEVGGSNVRTSIAETLRNIADALTGDAS